jgi:hypothetical protein
LKGEFDDTRARFFGILAEPKLELKFCGLAFAKAVAAGLAEQVPNYSEPCARREFSLAERNGDSSMSECSLGCVSKVFAECPESRPYLVSGCLTNYLRI